MSSPFFSSYPNRTMCDVLEELRQCYKTRNFAALLGLAEELQGMGNRLEAALGDKRDCLEWAKKRRELRKQLRTLERKLPKEPK